MTKQYSENTKSYYENIENYLKDLGEEADLIALKKDQEILMRDGIKVTNIGDKHDS